MRVLAILTDPSLQCILALAIALLWMMRDTKDKTRPWLVIALVLNIFYGFLLNKLMSREDSLVPWKYDHILYRLDQSLGLHAASIAGPLQGLWRMPLGLAYNAMIPMMIFWFFVCSRYKQPGSVVFAYAAELATGPPFYAIVPGCGPLYAFGSRWLHPPAVPADTIRLVGLPNAFPSLHAGTAMVFVLFAPSRLWRVVSLLFLGFTFMATLSTGEHYVVDLIAGLAFGAFAGSVGLLKFRQATGFLVVALGWSLVVRFAFATLIDHPYLVRMAAALTIVLVAAAVWKKWSEPAAPSGVATEEAARAVRAAAN